MKFSLFFEMQIANPTREKEAQTFHDCVAQAVLADQLGYHTVWEVEHHGLYEYSHSSAPEVFLAFVAAKTRNVRLGRGITLTPHRYNHPIRIAERVATLDILSGGRVSWGSGKSSSRTEQLAFENDVEALIMLRRLFAFVLDKKLISVLHAREKIPGSAVSISGSFSAADADDLALKLKSGAMRASMKFLEESSVGPSLGADSIRSGVLASLIGFLTIVVFMVFWYRWSGLNAIIALTVNVIVMLGLMGSFHAVITLPGIAGFALTVGMAVDANILIFERIREELDHGKSVAGAIDAGFSRVFWTIVDSHVTQLFAALLLFIFGTGPVKGFAVSLTVGVVASLFTSIYISRFVYDWILERHPGASEISIGRMRIFQNTTVDFMKYKGIALGISWGIIVACVLAAQPWKGSDSKRNWR